MNPVTASFTIKFFSGWSPLDSERTKVEARMDIIGAQRVAMVRGGFVFQLPYPVRISYGSGPEQVNRLVLFARGKLAAVTNDGNLYYWGDNAPTYEPLQA